MNKFTSLSAMALFATQSILTVIDETPKHKSDKLELIKQAFHKKLAEDKYLQFVPALDWDCYISCEDKGNQFLHLAAKRGMLKFTQALIAKFGNFESLFIQQNDKKKTPLQIATEKLQKHALKQLVDSSSSSDETHIQNYSEIKKQLEDAVNKHKRRDFNPYD